MEQNRPVQKISVVIPTRGKPTMLRKCLENLREYSGHLNMQVIVVEHETEVAAEIIDDLRPKDEPDSWKRIEARNRPDYEHSFSTLNNLGVQESDGNFILLLNNDVFIRKGTLDAMLKVFEEKKDVGLVGAKLLFPDRRIQHIGILFNRFGVPYHIGYEREDGPDYPTSQRSDYFDALTFALCMVKREVFDELNGMDTAYHFNYEDVDFCLRAKECGWRCYMTCEAVAIHMENRSSEWRVTKKHSVHRNLKVFEAKWIENKRLDELIDQTTETRYGPFHDDKLNILFLPASQKAGISWWRMHLPADMIRAKHLANVQFVYSGSMNERDVMDVMGNAHITVWQGQYGHGVRRLAELGKERSFRMAYEYDDHPIYLSPFAQVYQKLGTQEIKLEAKDGSETWLWRDGEGGFHLQRNREQRQQQLETMAMCDAMTTTTHSLADYFRTFSPDVYVLPNCIDFDRYPKLYDLYERKPGPVRIGWWGGDNHWHDVSQIGPWLVEYVNSHNVKLVLIGAHYQGPLRGLDPNKVEFHSWVSVDAFPTKLASAGIDVTVIPLASPNLPHMGFNRYKSEIKWLEASVCKWPSLVQAGVEPYSACIDGDNALTFSSKDEFLEKLDMLAKDADLRRTIAERGYEWAYENRNLEKEIYRWMDAYTRIVSGGREDMGTAPAKSDAVAEGG